MNRHAISLGKINNIPVEIDNSWFLIFIFLTWSLATGYFPAEFNQWTTVEYWLVGAATTIVFFISVLLHELGHSLVALHYKIPVRNITLFFFGGVSQITEEPSSAWQEFWIAIAGPLVSFGLGVIFYVLASIFAGVPYILALAEYLSLINIILAVFNLIPGYPLDGGRVFQAIWWGISRNLSQATNAAVAVGQAIAFFFIVLGVWLAFSGNFFNGIWLAFMGWFLDNAAISQKRQHNLHDILSQHQVSEAISRNYVIISAHTSLQELTDEHILGSGRRFFIVEDDSHNVCGVLPLKNIIAVPRQKWPDTYAEQIMIPVDRAHPVHLNTNLWEAVEEMDQEGANQQPVMENGQLQGVLSQEGVMSFLKTHRSPN